MTTLRVTLRRRPAIDGELRGALKAVAVEVGPPGPPGPQGPAGEPDPAGVAAAVEAYLAENPPSDAALEAHIAAADPHPNARSGFDFATFYEIVSM